MSETLIELAERCEKATGPDWKLGNTIALAVGWREEDYDEIGEEPGTVWVQPNGRRDMLPDFTGSLDAAMSLVPEGWQYDLKKGQALYSAAVFRWKDYRREGFSSSSTASLALAFCAAALRARSSIVEGGGL